MSELLSTELRKSIHELRFDPTRVMSKTLDLLESELLDEGAFVADPSQPLPFLVENDCILTAAAIEAYEASTMRQYPILAQTEEDLYLHMSDVDMVGMYASPGKATFTMLLSVNELRTRSVVIEDSGNRKITIPKNTQFIVNNYVFTMQYPVDIIIKSFGGIEISYDGTVYSPLQELEGSRIEWDYYTTRGDEGTITEFIRIDIPVLQMDLKSYKIQSNPTSTLKKTFTFKDHFYYARAYRINSVGEWVEMRTTHSDHTFDPLEPTLKLKVVDNQLKVELPYIYQLNGFNSATIRVDVYTTNGNVYSDLSAYSAAQIEIRFNDVDNLDKGKYTSAMTILDTTFAIVQGSVSGGSNPPTFDERREKVLKNAIGPATKPISPSQLTTTVERLGFDIMLNHDDILGRSYKISRPMELADAGYSVTPIDTTVMVAKRSMDELRTLETTRHSESTVTILPSTLYRDTNGELTICEDDERLAIEDGTVELKANMITAGRYLYTPLHYVLDMDNHHLESRPYLLTRPRTDIAGYSQSNETLDIFVQTAASTSVRYTDEGYQLILETESNDPYKELKKENLFAQLAFKPDLESDWVYVNGVFEERNDDDEWFVRFYLDTQWTINDKHQLALTNFTMIQNDPQIHHINLQHECYVIWGVVDHYNAGMKPSAIDDRLGRHLLPNGGMGIYRETLKINLGSPLMGLWRRAVPMIGSQNYETWDLDQYMYYESNIYDKDPETGELIIEEDPVTGKRGIKLLHAKGSPVLDSEGQPVTLFKKGDPKRDEYGDLIPLDVRTIQLWWDLVLFDAKYRYATNRNDSSYALNVILSIDEWVNETILPIREMALERTEISFQPRNTLKYVNVLVDDGITENIFTAQNLVVDLYMTNEAYRAVEMRTTVDRSIRNVLAKILERKQVLKDDIIDAIRDVLKNDVVTVNIRGLGGSENYDVITLLDDNARLCLGKMLVVESDGRLVVKDNVTINYRKHGLE